MTQPDPTDPTRFEEMYRDDRVAHGLPAATPWDIGGPQPVVQQLVALGAIRGRCSTRAPGRATMPSTTPPRASRPPASTGRWPPSSVPGTMRGKVGVSVDFRVADATKLEGLDGRFDTVVDCAFYHTFSTAPELQKSYVQALHRATKPGARLYMFEFGEHDVNGFTMERSLSQDDFRQVLPVGGWEITYMGPTTYQINLSVEVIEMMAARNPDMADEVRPMLERFRAMEPWLVGGRVHAPFWEVHATRLD
ncbi:methyltransferase domain protein [Mycobacterium kansasii 824]|nr:methyltransferase domain protein [Mycobacterium kansasii 824]